MRLLTLFFSLLLFPQLVWAETFEEWKQNYSKWASKHGVPRSFALKQLEGISPDSEVLDRYRNQVTSSSTLDYPSFIKKWLREDQKRLKRAQEVLIKHRELLEKVEAKYGVDKEVLVALWGVETFYGEIMGNYDVIRSLATLSHEGRRRRFYQIQLNAVFRLLMKGQVTREDLKGSWAGATGHCQFMPSNIPVYGQDFDGDGKVDLWNSMPDVFASMANLLKKAGWKKGLSIGSLALVPVGLKEDLNIYRSPKQYNQLGLTALDGSSVKANGWSRRRAAVIPLKNAPVVLRGSNYEPLLKWNNSSLFAAFNILIVDHLKKN